MSKSNKDINQIKSRIENINVNNINTNINNNNVINKINIIPEKKEEKKENLIPKKIEPKKDVSQLFSYIDFGIEEKHKNENVINFINEDNNILIDSANDELNKYIINKEEEINFYENKKMNLCNIKLLYKSKFIPKKNMFKNEINVNNYYK